ncbi:hypothetical protein FW778_13845 [Ginsengibacter hankyongi]|uniref:HNH endonuclease n=1 Tax=Ginsengibacter hankyongi TaxID=2607284 RepID=A0A5J5IHP0_9BACT|nr:hypothetical protein [Ginsengibacter hankyongi]KAA9038630.1 hypothetical protein FW778_13845 [Ginsengibacter hankyongi]
MVKIQLNNEQEILKFHYNNLTKKVGKEWNIEIRLRKRISQHAGNPGIVAMFQDLLDSLLKDSSGFSIITAPPKELSAFAQLFDSTHGHILNDALKAEILNAFYYEDYDKWRAYELAKKIGITVCPYCNRTYTFLLGNDSIKGTRFEYDHFFSKSAYPYLALSFYNLVPSCHVCNSNFKGFKEFSLKKNIHPYLEGFGQNIVFSIKPKNIGFINGKSEAYRIRFRKGNLSTWNGEKVKAAFENITTFQLTKLYNMHKDYVDELIQKSIVYNEEYINELYARFSGSLFKNKEEVKKLIVSNYIDEEDYHKRVLSKLTTDISKELGLI